MAVEARYAHTNIIAKDWRKLAAFYADIFGCAPVLPERDLKGKLIDDLTGMEDAHICGIHLRLPGLGDSGPTLEIFEFNEEQERPPTAINRQGLAHLAFEVSDVEAAMAAVLEAGGGKIGQLVTGEIPKAGRITLVYLTDPEGNIIELQKWG